MGANKSKGIINAVLAVVLASLFVIVTFVIATAAYAGEQAVVEQFSPQGTAKAVRQVTARFSEQMVSFGDPRTESPFNINCPEKGSARWIDTMNWAYDFDEDLPSGVSCTFTLKPSIKALSGTPVKEASFQFTTGGPSVLVSEPSDGSIWLDEKQAFVLYLDGVPDESSIPEHVHCTVDGIRERIGVTLIQGNEKEEILKAAAPALRGYKLYDKNSSSSLKTPVKNLVVLQCNRTFPSGKGVKIVWGKGVKSISGVASDIEQVLSFKTQNPFAATFHCLKERATSGCIPLTPMKLVFSAAVSRKTANQIVIKSDDGKLWRPKLDAEDEEDTRYTQRLVFEGPFPESTSFSVVIPEGLKDESGRALSNRSKFPMKVRTDAYPPLAKFASRFGIIEQKAGALLPITVRNIEQEIKLFLLNPGEKAAETKTEANVAPKSEPEKNTVPNTVAGKIKKIPAGSQEEIISWLRKTAASVRERPLLSKASGVKTFNLPKPGGTKAFEVIGIPLGTKGSTTGFYVVEVESAILGQHLLPNQRPMYVQAAALVTNLSTHLAWGRESSAVWVTTLDKGEPVNNAEVTLRDCTGKAVWQGKTAADGIARINQSLPTDRILPTCREQLNWAENSQILNDVTNGLFVFAKTQDDLTFTHSSWHRGIEPWRFKLPEAFGASDDPAIVHTVFDRTLLRAGQSINMKHILRKHTMNGFESVPEAERPEKAVIVHSGSNKEFPFPLKWLEDGSAETTWAIPEQASNGRYEVYLNKKAKPYDRRMFSGTFNIEDFRVVLMKAAVQGPAAPLIIPKEVGLDITVSYLSGGGAADLPVKLRAELQPKEITLPTAEGYQFSAKAVREGIETNTDQYADQYTGHYDSNGEDDSENEAAPLNSKQVKLQTIELNLDKNGTAKATLKAIPEISTPHDITAELEFRDPNGEIQTISSNIPVYPSSLMVGINPSDWAESKDALKYKVIVTGVDGKPRPNVPVEVDIFKKRTYSHRKRVAGGFYSYENIDEIKKIGRHCAGKTDEKGLLFCQAPSPASGRIIIQPTIKDDAGRPAFTNTEVFVAGKDEVWFDAGSDDRIDLISESRRYEIGETAKFQLRMPFKEATVWVTVGREGVMDTYVRTITRNNPAFEIPIKKNYAPNVYVSALAIRGRIDDAKPTALFDPGKPAFKLGITGIDVGWRPHELKVAVTTDKQVYKTRQEAKAKIKVLDAEGKTPPKGSSVIIAAVDEGLLELKPNLSWKLLEAMMKKRPYELKTSTSQAVVIGKRHFGRKSLPQGGGGGKSVTRELFDTLILWKATVKLDENGEAAVNVPLNDSLTAFKIVAIATSGTGHFGTGETSVRTSQDLMIFSGIPPLVRTGDKFTAGFTVRNTTEKAIDAHAELSVKGSDNVTRKMSPIKFSVPAGRSEVFNWQIEVPFNIDNLLYDINVKDASGAAFDSMRVKQKVVNGIDVRIYQAELRQIDAPFTVEVEKPADALQKLGGVNVTFKPKLSEGLTGISYYMSHYPYTCMEQKVSRAVSLRDKAMWNGIKAELPNYLDKDGFVKYFHNMRTGSEVLTAYILSISHEAGYDIPQETRSKMLSALTSFVTGKIVMGRSPIQAADVVVRKLSTIEALSRHGVADAAMLAPIATDPALLPTSALLDLINITNRVKDIPDRDKKLKATVDALRTRLNLQGTVMSLSSEKTDNLWWLMATPDANAVRLLLTTLTLEGSAAAPFRADEPKIAAGTIGRMRHGHWDSTVANAWGVLATERFSAKYESVPVTGISAAQLDKTVFNTDWAKTPKGGTGGFVWPDGKKSPLSISHNGTGKPWATIQSLAAIPLTKPLSSGYKIVKTITPVSQKTKGKWTKGDVFTVDLKIDAQADMTWVVVNDPVPSGTTILNRGLGRDSYLLRKSEKKRQYTGAWEAYREFTFEGVKVYYEYVPKGTWSISYTVRLNNDGIFQMPTTRVEALYNPEMFGEIPNNNIEVHK
ncbi:alpha-2-macroglobulin family protein [Candidatus Magnetominusculus xianensis]|uniref:Alpha-2-macroglobulin n=1 Tax=Candidatus Magnetominusculus xianensis TaxID=1748249 RepID=A0ABR5SER1_9BACT|nr:MG2 domain-containing protein [Candidatus Magnetominusculus xianensis]KWT82914.1 alpha-2-macroglobulin [Candidatus Magnetominusculus xianensis]MBF0405316.1 alpha-2-macroglobulin [Nitrospirota bacterium]